MLQQQHSKQRQIALVLALLFLWSDLLLGGSFFLLLPSAHASIIHATIGGVTGIFGLGSHQGNGGSGDDDDNNNKKKDPQFPPPPPPKQSTNQQSQTPPPPASAHHDQPSSDKNDQGEEVDVYPPPPPPGTEGWYEHPYENEAAMQQQQSWMNASPSWNNNNNNNMRRGQHQHQHPQQQHQQQAVGYDYAYAAEQDNHFRRMQRDLEASLQRQHELALQLQNATAALVGMQQREELHVRQLDVLTERVMDVEAQAAKEHNELLEYQANCSALDLEIVELHGQVEEWNNKCHEAVEKLSKQKTEQTKLEKKWQKAKREAEHLATLVERHRLEELRESYQQRKSLSSAAASGGTGGGGLLGWILGRSATLRDEEELEKLRDLAKSTLLTALRTERKNVEELETAVSVLEQNNSIIALQVQSRDEVIEELNERVAVFEEDKLVLKAALKQLQKEMADEAPKTQKLIQDLEEAHAENERLEQEMEQLMETQRQQVEALEQSIAQKEQLILESEANVTMIGEYVDKLEERLADFALARRDIEKREERCREMERNRAQVEQECASLREQVQRYETEHEELKSLLQELVQERTKLQHELSQSVTDQQEAGHELERLRDSLNALEQETTQLRQQQLEQSAGQEEDWKARVQQYEARITTLTEEHQTLEQSVANYQTELATLEQNYHAMVATRQELERELEEAQTTKTTLEARLHQVSEAQEMAQARWQQESELYQSRLAEVQAHAETLRHEQQIALEAQLQEQRLELERELVQEKERVQALLLEREQHEEQRRTAATSASEQTAISGDDEEDEDDYTNGQAGDSLEANPLLSADGATTQPPQPSLTDHDAMAHGNDGGTFNGPGQLTSGGVVDAYDNESSVQAPPLLPEESHSGTEWEEEGFVAQPWVTSDPSKTEPSLPFAGNEESANDNDSDAAALSSENATRPTKDDAPLRNATDSGIPNRRVANDQNVARKPSSEKKTSVTRSLRKLFARTTGLHGFFSKKYKRPLSQEQQQQQEKTPPPTAFVNNVTKTQRIPPRDPPGALPGNRQSRPGTSNNKNNNMPPSDRLNNQPGNHAVPSPRGNEMGRPPRTRDDRSGMPFQRNGGSSPPFVRSQPPTQSTREP
ncbi:hypothetical protein ACA910_012575 [Epithemia clementina (nom. ined.)]